MSWYNPLSWFSAAKSEAVAVEEKAIEAIISLETEADHLVVDFQKFAAKSADELAKVKAKLEADIAAKQAALESVNGELTKAQSVLPPPPPPATAPQSVMQQTGV